MKISVFNIVYTNRESIISCIGPQALEDFFSRGLVNHYSGESAPTELDLEINWNPMLDIFENYDLFQEEVKYRLEEETGLTVKSFNVRFNY